MYIQIHVVDIWSIALYGVKLWHIENWIRNTSKVFKCGLKKVGYDHLNVCRMKCYTETKSKGISYVQLKRKKVWIGHILRRNCLLKHAIEVKIEGRMEVTGRRERRRKHLLDVLKKKRDYWKLKEEVLDRNLWRTRFVTGYSPVVKQTKNERRNI